MVERGLKMNTKLVFLLLCGHIGLLYASDSRLVPSWNLSRSDEQVVPQGYRPTNNDRVVPQINISPLGVHHDNPIDVDPKRVEKFPLIPDSKESIKLGIDSDEIYPAPRARIEENDSKNDSKIDSNEKSPIPTPRARIQDDSEKPYGLQTDRIVRSSLEKDEVSRNDNVIRDDPKPFAFVYNAKPVEVDLKDNSKFDSLEDGQSEEILIIQDVNSTEEDDISDSVGSTKGKEISNAKIQRYIDEIDREYNRKNNATIEVKDKVVDSSLGLRKYVINAINSNVERSRREAVKSKIVVPPIPTSNDKIPASGDEKISNERKTSGGLAYNVNFEEPKGSKPSLSSSPRRKREAVKPIVPSNPPISSSNDKSPPLNDKTLNNKPLLPPASNDKIPASGDEKISNERKTSGGLAYNVNSEEPKGLKPSLSPRSKREAVKSTSNDKPLVPLNGKVPSLNDKTLNNKPLLPPASNDKIPASGDEKISNERKTSGGLAYNVNFEEPKGSKPSLSSSPRRKRESNRPFAAIFDHENNDAKNLTKPLKNEKLDELFKSIRSSSSEDSSIGSSESSESEELVIGPNQGLPQIPLRQNNEKTFDEVLEKVVKDHKDREMSKDDNVYQQEVNRLPHKGPTLKNSGILAIDPPASHESDESNKTNEESQEIGIIVVEKTILLDNDESDSENQTKNVFIKDSEVNFNLVNASEERLDSDNENSSFWHNGFTIGIHISPLAMCIGTAIILTILLMRLALKIHKKRLQAEQSLGVQNPGYSGNDEKLKKHEFDNVSLQTVSTN